MLHRTQKKRRPILAMITANLDAWLHSPRTVLLLIFTIALCYMEVSRSMRSLSSNGIILHWVEAPYKLLEYGVNFLMSSILFLVMISEIPRKMPYQNHMLIRSDRKRWLTSQILYSLALVLLVLLMLVICILVFSFAWTIREIGWSDPKRIMDGVILETQGVVPLYVREHFTPSTSTLYATLPIFCFWFSMAMVVLFSSLLGSSSTGLLVCAFALLAQFIGSYPLPYPIMFAYVQNMNPDQFGPSLYWKAIGVYAGLNVLMIFGMYFFISKTDLAFFSENKL